MLHRLDRLQRRRTGPGACRRPHAARRRDPHARELDDGRRHQLGCDALVRAEVAGMSVIVLLIVAGGAVAAGFLVLSSGPCAAASSTTPARRRFGCCSTMGGRPDAVRRSAGDSHRPGTTGTGEPNERGRDERNLGRCLHVMK